MKAILGFAAGVATVIVAFYAIAPRPTFTSNAQGWKLEHIPVPACKDGWTRSVDLPERDEVDAMTVTCAAHLPDASLNLDAQGRTIDYVQPSRNSGCMDEDMMVSHLSPLDMVKILEWNQDYRQRTLYRVAGHHINISLAEVVELPGVQSIKYHIFGTVDGKLIHQVIHDKRQAAALFKARYEYTSAR